MRYSVPVQAAGEIDALARAGASELYCGYLDAWWAERYGDHDSASRRQGAANILSEDELRATAKAARQAGTPLHLALNARYSEPMLDHLAGLCARFEDWGGTGVIASDLGLLWRLREQTGLVRTLSILAVAQNVETIEAYRQLGVTRIVLPRFVEPDEASLLLAAVPGIEASVMAFFDKCPWVDGYCRHRHGVSYPEREVQDDTLLEDAPPLYTFDTTYRTHACLRGAKDAMAPYPCAACQLAAFERAGVGVAKLGGRGRLLDERLRALRFLRKAEQLNSGNERKALYRETFGVPCACYYGERTQRRDAIELNEVPASAPGRRVVGSQTSWIACVRAIEALRKQCDGEPVTLLLPPLSEGAERELMAALPELLPHLSAGSLIAVNDLGTLVVLARALSGHGLEEQALGLRLGTLLARLDDPREVAHFLSSDENPARPIFDLEGHPRMLTWSAPPATLVEHWRRASNAEPSAQTALEHLCGSRIELLS